MHQLKGKTVLITGASSGIGRACAEVFAGEGCRVIMCARGLATLNEIADELRSTYDCEVLTRQLDVRSREQVSQNIDDLPANWAAIDILVNNAGLALGMDKIATGSLDDWETIIDTNVKGLLYLTRAVLPGMIKRQTGHVINIGSVAGVLPYVGGAVYSASKAAVRVLSDGMRMDLVDQPIRVTNVQPGMTETNFSVVRFRGEKSVADRFYEGITPLTGKDIADVVLYCASVPSHVQISEISVMPVNQALTNMVHREPVS